MCEPEEKKTVLKTKHCSHRESCVQNIHNTFGRGFIWCFMTKYMVSKILRSGELRSMKDFYKIMTTVNRDSVCFALITTSIQTTYKALLCLARSFSEKNPDCWAAPLAGLIAGMWLKLDSVETRRNLIMILVFSKAIDCLINMIIRYIYKFNKEND